MRDLAGAEWRKSTRSGQSGNCVEVADNLTGIVGVRDSKNPDGGVLTVNPSAWSTFVAGVKLGEFDRT